MKQVIDQVEDHVRGQAWGQVEDQVGGLIRDQVWGQIGDQIEEQTG